MEDKLCVVEGKENLEDIKDLVFRYGESRPFSSTLLIAETLGIRHDVAISILRSDITLFAGPCIFGVVVGDIRREVDMETGITFTESSIKTNPKAVCFDLVFDNKIVEDVYLVHCPGFLNIVRKAYNTNKSAYKILKQFEEQIESVHRDYYFGYGIDEDVLKTLVAKIHGCKDLVVKYKELK